MPRRQPNTPPAIANYLLSFLAGSFILCLFATSQKLLVGAPLIAKGYVAPVLYGGCVAVILRRWIARAQTSEHLRKLSERRYGQLFDQSSELIFTLTEEGLIRYTNPACQKVLGYTTTNLAGRRITELISATCLNQWQSDVRRLREQEYLPPLHTTLVGCQGQKIYLAGNLYLEHPDSNSYDIRAVFQDISSQKLAQEALESSEKKLSTIFHNSSAAVITVDCQGNFIKVNEAFCQMVGYREQEIYHKCWRDLCHPEDWPKLEHLREKARGSNNARFEFEVRLNHRADRPVWGLLSSSWVTNTAGEPDYTVAIIQDISDGKLAHERIKKLSLYDPLTGLPNRSRLRRKMEEALSGEDCVGLLTLDLDKFKQINDTLGPTAGDRLLQDVADRLRAIRPGNALLSRTGGDEFALLLTPLDCPTVLSELARKVLEVLEQPFSFTSRPVITSASIGLVFSCENSSNAESLLMHADSAMYAAKERGGNQFQFFSSQMNEKMLERLTLEEQLRKAIEHNELELYYQPQIDLKNNRVCGFEALLRWNHPQRGLLTPNHFISIAEECGFITTIDSWVINQACCQNAQWQQQGLPAVTVAVNLSSQQFHQPELGQYVKQVLQRSGLDACYLELELTESSVMEDLNQAEQTMQQLRQLGVALAIDDFGTGYSSLNYLKHFPLTHLKIDRSFVCDLCNNTEDQLITNAIIALANSLNLRVIAEGVESAGQLEYLQQNACHEIQGYLFSQPLPADKCPEFLTGYTNFKTSA